MTSESTTPPHAEEHIDEHADEHIDDGHDDLRSPPAPPPAPPIRRLVRDPYTRLGGVASGIAHYTGLDTSIVRILFIITTFTGGFGLFVYLVAWLVIPRADHWPPATRPVSFRDMSGRDLGIGLALVGVLVAVGFGATGATGGILVPLALVAGGVWLLVQPPSTPVAATGAGGDGATPFVSEQNPIGAPVPPPKRRRSRWLIALAVVVAVLALLMVPVVIVLGLAFGSIGDTTRISPTTIDEIPAVISDDFDHLELDLSRLDAADFSAETMPVEVAADVAVGSILVIVPDDISLAVDSNVGFGSITVFGDEVDGPDITFQATDSGGLGSVDLEFRLDVDLGQIDVRRP